MRSPVGESYPSGTAEQRGSVDDWATWLKAALPWRSVGKIIDDQSRNETRSPWNWDPSPIVSIGADLKQRRKRVDFLSAFCVIFPSSTEALLSL